MRTAIHFTGTSNMRPMAGSIALHVVICVWFLSSIVPVEIMPQQMIRVTMIAAPAPSLEIMEQKSETLPQEKRQPKKAVESVKQPLPRQESARAMVQQQIIQASPSLPQTLASLSPSAGNNADAQASAQLVTTAPLFDAAYLNNPAPEYPAQAKRRSIEGSVMLGVLVAENGLAKSVNIAKSSGFAMLDESAKDAVSRWKFVPARKGNITVEARVMVPIDFRLE